MFSILAILTRNELLGFFRSKSALFWALAFPILLLTVMLMAFGHPGSLGTVNIQFLDADAQATSDNSCQLAIQQAFAGGDPVKANFSTVSSTAPLAADTVRIVFAAATNAMAGSRVSAAKWWLK